MFRKRKRDEGKEWMEGDGGRGCEFRVVGVSQVREVKRDGPDWKVGR